MVSGGPRHVCRRRFRLCSFTASFHPRPRSRERTPWEASSNVGGLREVPVASSSPLGLWVFARKAQPGRSRCRPSCQRGSVVKVSAAAEVTAPAAIVPGKAFAVTRTCPPRLRRLRSRKCAFHGSFRSVIAPAGHLSGDVQTRYPWWSRAAGKRFRTKLIQRSIQGHVSRERSAPLPTDINLRQSSTAHGHVLLQERKGSTAVSRGKPSQVSALTHLHKPQPGRLQAIFHRNNKNIAAHLR